MKTKSLIILIILLVLLGLVSGFVYWSKYVKPGIKIETPTFSVPSVVAPLHQSSAGEQQKPKTRGFFEQSLPFLKEVATTEAKIVPEPTSEIK